MARTVQWAIEKAFLHANRKATAPNAGSSKHDVLLALADSTQKLWAAEEGIEWNSLSDTIDLGPVTATDTFALPDSVDYVSQDTDQTVRIGSTDYKLVSAAQLRRYRDSAVVAQIGRNLVFPRAFAATDAGFGLDIEVPVVLAVSDITAATDTIQVDRPMWLAYMMAAEFVRNDVVKQGQYDNLLALADVEMGKMKEANASTVNDYALNGFQAAGAEWN
jgi:hypothetical protein